MKWALKFSTKGKGGADAGKPYNAHDSGSLVSRSGEGEGAGGGAGDTNGSLRRTGEGGFRSGDGLGSGGGGSVDYYNDERLEPGQDRDTPAATPPDAVNGGGRGRSGSASGPDQLNAGGGGDDSSVTNEGEEDELDNNNHNNGPAAAHRNTGDLTERPQQGQGGEGGGEGEDMDYVRQQQEVFDEDGDSQADSLRASKTARMKSFADDPDAHVLGDADADWDAAKERRDGDDPSNGRSPPGSRGEDRSSGNADGEGSHSDHSSQGEPNDGVRYASNPSREDVDREGRSRGEDEGEGDEEEENDLGHQQREHEGAEGNEDYDERRGAGDDGDDRRHHGDGVGNGAIDSGGSHGGGHSYNVGDRTARDQADLERRAMAHAYADGLDGVVSREAPGGGGRYLPPGGGGDGGPYGSGGGVDPYQQRSMPPAPPDMVNGISPVDARAAASLAARTRLAAGGVAVPDRSLPSGIRPEPGPVMAPGPAAAAAAAALRRGPTPGSHSLPSMVLVPLEALKAHRRVPRSSDRRALVRYRDLPDRSRSFVVFVSHAWMRPHTTPSFAHPDTSSRGGEKYRLIAEAGDRIRAHLPPDVRVLLWIDYSCVDQDSTRRSKATMRGMREYMRRCDAILTVYPGEAADNGEEFLPNRFVKSCSWAGSYKSLAHYCTRGWCRLEMLLGQTEPLPQDGFMFNFLVPKKKKASGAKASIGDRPHFLYGAHQRPHNGRIDVVPRQSSRWFEEHHPEQGNFTHESDRDAIRTVLAKQTSTMAKRSAALAARYGTDPRRGGSAAARGGGGGSAGSGGGGGEKPVGDEADYGRPH